MLDKDGNNKFNENINDLIARGSLFNADTIEDLAKQLGMKPDVLVATVKNWNEMCKTQKDPEFGRSAFASNITLLGGPFYASPRKPSVHHTMGGVQINDKAQALDKNGKVIRGLWAAGEVPGSIHGTNRLGANAVPDAISFGRIAGKDVSKSTK